MRGKVKFSGILILLFIAAFALSLFASAQEEVMMEDDNDGDGVVNGMDMCPGTNPEEGLPIMIKDKTYLGCACSQIYEETGDNYCFDIFCSSNRPLLIEERMYSSRETNCSNDYCLNSTLYDFPANTQVLCVGGKERQFDCTPKVIEGSEECVNGTIRQYEWGSKKEDKGDVLPVLLDDYEKLRLRAYGISQDVTIRTSLGISGEEVFARQEEKTMNSLKIDKHLATEKKELAAKEMTISFKKITITPNKYITLKDVYVFEELPRESEVKLKDIISESEIIFQEESPALIVWKLDKISGPVEISYQVNKPLQGESNTLIIAKEVINRKWMLGLIPLAMIIVFIIIFMHVSAKSVPRRKKIFKD